MAEPTPDREAQRREVLRVYRRYQREIVEGLGFCPYAARARQEGKVREEVLFGADLDEEAVLEVVQEVAADPSVEIGILILPQVTWDREFHVAFVKRVEKRHADVSRREQRAYGSPTMALAPFHPAAESDPEPDPAAGHRLIPFLRRTPDPVIQLVRLAVLERVRQSSSGTTRLLTPDMVARMLAGEAPRPQPAPLHARIEQANVETVQRLGVDEVAARIEAIQRDRDQTYARLGLK